MRLIDADALVAQEQKYLTKGAFSYDVATHTIEIVQDAPTVEAVPLRHAKLINPTPYGECSICGTLIDIRDEFNYCPHCGAKIDLKED